MLIHIYFEKGHGAITCYASLHEISITLFRKKKRKGLKRQENRAERGLEERQRRQNSELIVRDGMELYRFVVFYCCKGKSHIGCVSFDENGMTSRNTCFKIEFENNHKINRIK